MKPIEPNKKNEDRDSVIRISVVMRSELFREGLGLLINAFDQCQIGMCAASVIGLKLDSTYHILLIDSEDISNHELAILSQLNMQYPNLKTVVLTSDFSDAHLTQLIHAGISGFYSKEITSQVLEKILHGSFDTSNLFEIEIGPIARKKMAEMKLPSVKDGGARQEALAELSDRELEILNLTCAEKTNLEISQTFDLSIRTVEAHKRKMIKKTGSRNSIGLVVQAFQKTA